MLDLKYLKTINNKCFKALNKTIILGGNSKKGNVTDKNLRSTIQCLYQLER